MATLDSIREPVAAELSAYEEYLHDALRSPNAYVSSVLNYIFGTRGKGIRPLLVMLSGALHRGTEPIGERSFLAAMLIEMLHTATGRRPLVIGKPQPEMALLAMERTGFSPEQTVLLGDRLYTDVACGVNAGIDTVFVLSGEGTEADIAQYDIHPTWIFSDIAALYRQLEETL